MVLQVAATGGRASSQLQALRNAGYVEYWDDPDNPTGPDRVRVTEVGKKALAATALKEPLTYRLRRRPLYCLSR
jgi:DNA-binding MarR family transcriptional regulator